MSVRKYSSCGKCALWRAPDGQALAGRPLAEVRSTEGECRRRVQTAPDGPHPRQPVTPPNAGCSEAMQLPAPERLPSVCIECRFWRPLANGREEGLCCVWAPRWSHKQAHPEDEAGKYAYPVTEAGFFCGDGVSLHHVDPDELTEDAEEEA